MENGIKEIEHLLPKSKLVKNQSRTERFRIEDKKENIDKELAVTIRYDDECENGHNSFSITGDFHHMHGCIHEEIAQYAPQFKKYFKWHLTSSDGPMYYLANTLYHAGDRDCHGKRKGEPKSFDLRLFVNKSPLPYVNYTEKFLKWIQENWVVKAFSFSIFPDFNIVEIQHRDHNKPNKYPFSSKFSFNDFATEWCQCPFDSLLEAETFLLMLKTCDIEIKSICTAWGEGKEPDLNAARSCAVWPEAQLEDFTKEKLLARLPKLMEEFKKDMEELGFIY